MRIPNPHKLAAGFSYAAAGMTVMVMPLVLLFFAVGGLALAMVCVGALVMPWVLLWDVWQTTPGQDDAFAWGCVIGLFGLVYIPLLRFAGPELWKLWCAKYDRQQEQTP